MGKIRFEEMFPDELIELQENERPVYLPVGSMEWHSFHLGMGVDTLHAQRIAEELAERLGGAVFPSLYIGTENMRSPESTKPQSEVSKHQNDVLKTSLSALLSLKEMAVIRQIQDNPNISITAIAANTRLSKSTIDRVIRSLKEKGLLTRTGAKNNATWLINYGCKS